MAWGALRSRIDFATGFFVVTSQQMEQKPTAISGLNPAVIYLAVLRAAMVQAPELYLKFLDLLELFHSGSIPAAEVIRRMSVLFHEFPSFPNGLLKLLLNKCGVESTYLAPDITSIDPNLANYSMAELIKDMEDGIVARFQQLMPLWSLLGQLGGLEGTDVNTLPPQNPARTAYELFCVQDVAKLMEQTGALYQKVQDVWRNYDDGALSKHEFFQKMERNLAHYHPPGH
jgi:hypothetical protein